jgi:phospholipid/cholesterol/gamma-HCH transport system substrate-binding protein
VETRANNIIVGLFVVAGFALALAFAGWIARSGDTQPKRSFYVVFTGSVQGLSPGGAVLYNGLRVGEVNDIRINPANPSEIRARISVDELTPIRSDTKARLTYGMLTGVASIDLSGGTEQAGDLTAPPGGGLPTIVAERSFVQNLLEGGTDTLARINSVVQRVDDLVATNGVAITATIRNVQSFSEALAQNNQALSTLVSDASIAARRVADVSARLETVVAAMDPNRVRETVDGIAAVVTTLAEQREQIGSLIADASRAARGLGDTAERLAPSATRLQEILTAVDPAAVGTAIANFGRAADGVARVTEAVDPARVRSMVDNLASVSETLGAERERIAGLIQDVGRAARNVADASATVEPSLRRAGEILAAIDPARVGSAVEGFDRAAGNLARATDAVDPERVRRTVDNVAALSDSLAAERDRIAGLVQDVSRAARNIADASANLDPSIRRAGEILQAVDPQAVQRSVENIERFAGAVGRESERFGAIASDAQALVQSLRRSATEIENFTRNAGGQDGEGVLGEITATARSIRTVAENLDRRVTQIGSGLSRFTDQGLRDLQNLITDGRRTLANLDRVFRDIERNPQQFIFGRSGVPDYRRR